MELLLTRFEFSELATIGVLEIDGQRECYTLEDCVRPEKIKGRTAIPAGKYEIAVTWSNRFKRPLPLLLSVPNFEGIRIHPGNTAADTEGCLLVGKTRGNNWVGESRSAFEDLFEKLVSAAKREKITIEIVEKREKSNTSTGAPEVKP